ncbi:MAG: hypothetical protein GY856_05310, partial [bacterium]|nr:hypothetical protein [bacterium]
MQGKSIQTLVNDQGHKLADRSDSVTLPAERIPSRHTNAGNSPGGGHCPPSAPRAQLLYLLHTPLAELSPPGLPPGQRAGLRALPESNRLKLLYAFKALEPLAERPPDAAYRTLHLTAEILAALGSYAARRPVSLTALRFAASLTVIDLRNPYGSPLEEAEIFLTPQVLQLEAAALMPIWRARSAGKSD